MRKAVIWLTAGFTLTLLACGSPAPTTNAEKCKAIGGTYSASAKSCQLQSE